VAAESNAEIPAYEQFEVVSCLSSYILAFHHFCSGSGAA
jgi:hypothetical protein